MIPTEAFSIESSALPHGTRVLAFRGEEALSRTYRFEVYVLVERAASLELDMDAALGQRATLRIHRDDATARQWTHGVIDAIELLHELPGDALYRVELVPKLRALSRSHHHRVFVDKSVPDVLEAVLRLNGMRAGADYVLRLERSYRAAEHICQYRESDLAFLSRWMEREGMYWFFEHGDDGERLVITDAKGFHEPLARGAIRFVPGPATGDTSTIEALRVFTSTHRAVPAAVQMRDYDYLHPELDVSATQPVTPGDVAELHFHGDNVATPADARRLAGLRAEEQLARRARYHGEGRAFDLRTGYLFELDDHPRPAFNGRYLVTTLRHEGNHFNAAPEARALLHVEHEDGYRVTLDAIPARVQFRPERVTPWPRVYGIETATVCGAAESDYAQIDAHGRYKVRLHCDEGGGRNGRASMWVRMLQPHAGSPEGFHFPLRKNTEVLLVFLGGDPDRPVISGAVPNALTPTPVAEGNHTFNVLHTGGDNRLEMQDAAGAQHVDLSSPTQSSHLHLGATGQRTHNFALSTDGTGLIHTGGDHDVTVDANLTEHVVGDVSESYDANQTVRIGANLDERYGANNLIKVGGDQTLQVMGDQSTSVLGDRAVTVAGDQRHAVTGHDTVTIVAGQTTTITAGQTHSVVGGQTTSVIGGHTASVVGGQTLSVIGGQKESIIGGRTAVIVADDTLTVAAKRTVTVGADHQLTVGGSNKVTVSGEHSADVLGHEITCKTANSTEIVGGLKNEVFGGIKTSLTAGLALTLDFSLSHEIAPFKKKDKGLTIAAVGVSIETNGPHVLTAAIVVIA